MIFLKFPDEATFLAKAEEAGLTYTDDEGNSYVSTGSHEYSLDVVGIIYTPAVEEYNEETQEHVIITPAVPHEGYHINMLGIVPENFQEYVLGKEDIPRTPHRIFAGH